MKVTYHPVVFCDKKFTFNLFWGCLISRKNKTGITILTNSLVVDSISNKEENIGAVNNPFRAKERKRNCEWKNIRHFGMVKAYAKVLTWLCSKCYPLAILCLHFRLNIFNDAGDASMFYYNAYPDMSQQSTLCLPRAMFVASTSRRFHSHGTLFIGAFLPTVRMHAWVMEDGAPADRFDKQWMHYRPLMTLS